MDTNLIIQYGWQNILIAIAIVAVIGIFKTFLKAKYGSRSDTLKVIYQSMCIVLSICAAIIYNSILQNPLFTTFEFYISITTILAAVQVVYSFYENYGLRKLLGLFAKCLYAIFNVKEKDISLPSFNTDNDE